MANDEGKLASAALAIALVALLTALGQLLGQYFSTADGYRKCQRSVMGNYAKRTHRVWRWREFRFETVYVVPEIFLTGNGAPILGPQILLTGSEDSRKLSLMQIVSRERHGVDQPSAPLNQWGEFSNRKVAPENKLEEFRMAGVDSMKTFAASFTHTSGEMVCWIPFLHWIHETTHLSLNSEQKLQIGKLANSASCPPVGVRLPAIILKERSWDFQPPDVPKPLAKSTLSDIAVMARRMGMRWKDFRPSEGILRAEGHSHIITSTMVRSLGIVLQYSYTGRENRLQAAEKNHQGRRILGSALSEYPEVYIPSARADRLGCGVIRTHRKFGLPDFTISTQAEIVTALSVLDKSGASSVALNRILKETPDFKFRVADLVALTIRDIWLPGSELVQVPAPSDNTHGVTTSAIGRREFRLCLEEYTVVHRRDVGPLALDALSLCKEIGRTFAAWDYTDELSIEEEPWVVNRDCRYLERLQGAVHQLTNILVELEHSYPPFRYLHLLGAHIKEGMFADGEETSVLRNFGNDYRADVKGYFGNLPRIQSHLAKIGITDGRLVVDAWVTMMMRAFCWGAMHFFVPGERVPIQYFGSQLPVYIG